VVSTTYAVITLVMDPIGRLVTDERDHRSLPVAATAISAHRARTAASGPAGTAGVTEPVLTVAVTVAARAGAAAPAVTISPAATAPTASRPAIRIGLPPSTSERIPTHSVSAGHPRSPVAIEFSSERVRPSP